MSIINYKILLFGNSRVGKGTLFHKLSNSEINNKNISTIFIDRISFQLDINFNEEENKEKKSFEINLFRTAGNERYKSILYGYYKETQGIIFIYDITNKNSFDNVENWIFSIKETIPEKNKSKYVFMIIGNKLDLVKNKEKEREVGEDDAKNICEKYNVIWGGERSFKEIDVNGAKKLLEKYVKEIYKKVGIMEVDKQKIKNLENYKNVNKKIKEKKCLIF